MNILPGFLRRWVGDRPALIRILDNIGWLIADRGVRMAVGLVVSIMLARYLGPRQFGIISYATALAALFGIIALLGLRQVVVRDLIQQPESGGETIGSAIIMMLVGGVLGYGLLVVSVILARPDDPVVQVASVIIGATILFRAAEVADYWFEAHVNSKFVIWARNVVFLIASAVKVTLILLGAPLMAFVVVILVQAIVGAVATMLVLGIKGPDLAFLRVRLSRIKSLLVSSWPMMLSSMAVLVYMKIDQLMIASILDDEAVGVYSAAVSVSEATYVFAMIVTASLFPAIISVKQERPRLYLQRFQHLFDSQVLFACAIAIPTSFVAVPFVTTVFGEPYRDAGIVLAVHIWASVFVFLGVVSNRWFVAEGREVLNMQRTILGAVTNVLLNLLLIPRFQLIGAAVATVAAHLVAAFLSDLLQEETRPLFRMKLAALNIPRAAFRVSRGF